MDFFVSKVALSICALLVVAIMGEVMDRDRFIDDAREIETILQDFCSSADTAYQQRYEGSMSWTVPMLSTGKVIDLVLDRGIVLCRLEGKAIVRQPQCVLHTWRWDGSALNESRVMELDMGSSRLTVRSGDIILLTTVQVLFENDHKLLVFASS